MESKWEAKANEKNLDVYIYGEVESGMVYDAESSKWKASETSSDHIRKVLDENADAENINIYINSCGGSISEGIAIFNQLKRHKAKKTVYIDAFACSIASVIAMAGDKIIMPVNSVLMIHNASSIAYGNAEELRKAADDLDVLSEMIRNTYVEKSNGKLTSEQVADMMNKETFITAEKALEYGLIDEVSNKSDSVETAKANYITAITNSCNSYINTVKQACAISTKEVKTEIKNTCGFFQRRARKQEELK